MIEEDNYLKDKERKVILSPKIDVIFQVLFGETGSEEITKDLLSTILDEQIIEVDLNQNIVLRRMLPNDKMGIVDVLAKINNNEYCNIEMQMMDKKNMIKRMIYYWARQYAKEIRKGDSYEDLKRTISVLIANFEIDNLDNLGFHTQWKIIETKGRKKILTEDFELHIIELSKMRRMKAEGKDVKLKEWLCFLENPESKEVLNYMENNKNMKKAKEKLDVMSEDEVLVKLAELREKAILDEHEAEHTGYCKGKEEGISEGKKIESRQNAKKMKNKGYSIEEIAEITSLSKEEIEKL